MRTDILLSTPTAERPPMGAILGPGLRAVFIAINPSSRSARIGYSFSSPGNPFWRLLHESGLTPVRLAPSDEHQLLDHGLGLVSTVARATPAAASLSRAELREGAALVRGQLAQHRPSVVVLLGLTLYPVFVPAGRGRGPGLMPDRVGDAELFVLPNPSGRNRAYPGFAPKLVWYQALAARLMAVATSRTESS